MIRDDLGRVSTRAHMMYDANKKSVGASYLLWFFLGYLGAHRFYLGRTGSGLVQLLLALFGWLPFLTGWALLLVWWVVDAFLIPGIATKENMRIADRYSTFL
jgi:TM2 domain-containing membrane protein YozV